MATKSSKSSNFTEEELKEISKVFHLFDHNGDGHISETELGTALRSLNVNPTQKELKDMIELVDRNENGMIEFNEFLEFMNIKQTENKIGEEELKQSFQYLDKNGNGRITAKELRYVMKNLGEKLTDEEVDEMIREADRDGSGDIDYEEYVAMMMRA